MNTLSSSPVSVAILDSLVRKMGADRASAWVESTVNVRDTARKSNRVGTNTGDIESYFRGAMARAMGSFPEVFIDRASNFDECLEDILSVCIIRAESEHDPLHEGDRGAVSYPTFLFRGIQNKAYDWAKSKSRKYANEMSANEYADRDGTGMGSATDTLFANSGKFETPDHERIAEREYAKNIWDRVVSDMSDRDREYVTRRANGEESQVICKDLGVSNGTGTFVWQRTIATVERLTESTRV